METDRRRGTGLDPKGATTPLAEWADMWVETVDVEPRTEENYRSRLRNHILPTWGGRKLGEISASEVTRWFKELRGRYAASTVAGIRTVFKMLMEHGVDERLIASNPVLRRRRGRRRDRAVPVAERVWAMPEHIVRVAEQAAVLGGTSARQDRHRSGDRGVARVVAEGVARAAQDPGLGRHDPTADVPHRLAARAPSPSDEPVRVHQPDRVSAAAQ